MKKYIDADKLKERVTRLIASARQNDWPLAEDYLRRVIDTIDSLQQEQIRTNEKGETRMKDEKIVPIGTEMTVDWSSFRREAAKDIFCAMVSHLGDDYSYIERAVFLADELIKQLKQE